MTSGKSDFKKLTRYSQMPSSSVYLKSPPLFRTRRVFRRHLGNDPNPRNGETLEIQTNRCVCKTLTLFLMVVGAGVSLFYVVEKIF